jgi:polysaccharide pyruvyl transferase WcaK-like protein
MHMHIITCSASSIVGIRNFGDELLTDIYRKWIEACEVPTSVSHLSINQHGVLSREARALIDSATGVIFTGGGYFSDGDAGPGHVLRRHLRALRNRQVYWTVFQRARGRGIPSAVMGVEVGPLQNPLYRNAVRSILSESRTVVVRNETSRVNAQEILGGPKEILVYLDAALTVDRKEVEASRSTRDEFESDELRIGVHVHTIKTELEGSGVVSLVRKIVNHAPASRTVRVYYIHDQTKGGTHPSRSVRAENLIREAFPDSVVIPYREPIDTLRAVSAMDLVITSKLHVGVVARALEVPVLALGVHPKIRRFYEALGEADACGSVQDFAAAGLPDRLMEGLGPEWRQRIPMKNSVRESALQNRNEVLRFLGTLSV